MIGWFKCHRGLWLKSGLSIAPKRGEKARRLEAWIWLLSRANYEDNLHHDPPLRAGQLIATRGEVAGYTNWTDAAVRAWFKALESEGRITRETEGRTTVMTITNWHLYQGSGRGSVLGPDEQPSQDRTSNQASDKSSPRSDSGNGELGPDEQPSQDQGNDQARTDKNKEGRREKGEDPPKPPKGGSAKSRKRKERHTGPFTDERGHVWPDPDVVTDETFPKPWLTIWQMWFDADKACPGVRRGSRAPAYRALYGRLTAGKLTATDAYRASQAYLAAFRHPSEKQWPASQSKNCSTFWSEKGKHWEDWLPTADTIAAEQAPQEQRQWTDLTADQRFRLMYPISCEHEVYDVPDCAPHWDAADEATRRRWVEEAKNR